MKHQKHSSTVISGFEKLTSVMIPRAVANHSVLCHIMNQWSWDSPENFLANSKVIRDALTLIILEPNLIQKSGIY